MHVQIYSLSTWVSNFNKFGLNNFLPIIPLFLPIYHTIFDNNSKQRKKWAFIQNQPNYHRDDVVYLKIDFLSQSHFASQAMKMSTHLISNTTSTHSAANKKNAEKFFLSEP